MSSAASGVDESGTLAGQLGAMSFEDALAELERIVQGLEGGKQRLEDAIGAYERGAALRAHCETKLREAEMRVERIVTGRGAARDEVRAEPMDGDIPF